MCRLLKEKVSHYDWGGFYLADPSTQDELILGPFAGDETEHTRIPFGKGICGQAADRRETFVVQDVAREASYLSCSPKVKSETVVPMFRSGKLVGELDIDSHRPSAFSEEDIKFLESACKILAQLF